LEQSIEEFLPMWSLAPLVHTLEALRGVSMIVAVTFALKWATCGGSTARAN
jgi:hypothetical protein